MATILVVDDEPSILKTLETHLTIEGHRIHPCQTLAAARSIVERERIDMVFLDAYLGRERGLDFLIELKKTAPELPVVMISGQSEMTDVVQALKAGAFDFLEKPLEPQRLSVLLAHAVRQKRWKSEVEDLRETWKNEHFFQGENPSFRRTVALVEKAAPTDLTILITGPNGSGKEPLAYLAYLYSKRLGKPWVTANCAAIASTLFESTFFGHTKGAFTGAVEHQKGLFVQADTGTLFLDEIGELPLDLQAKFLRVLESKEVVPVGGDQVRRVDVRLIAATNRDLEAEVAAGRFREDLYYRLCQIVVPVPPLKERSSDIPGLVEFFLSQIDRRRGTQGTHLSERTAQWLVRQDFPGNVRQLRNWVERAALLSSSSELTEDDFWGAPGAAVQASESGADALFDIDNLVDARQEFERVFLNERLRRNGGSIKKAAESLGMLPNNLSRRLSELASNEHDEKQARSK